VCEGMVCGATPSTHPGAEAVACWIPAGVERRRISEYRPGQRAAFIRYGTPRAEWAGALVVHARDRGHVPMRNWPQGHWHKLARRIFREGLAPQIICIGTRDHALGVEGALDMRDAPLQRQMDVLASALLAIGPSSGPMHLASLCGCPHVVWCGGGAAERSTTVGRYRSGWNPHGTPVHAHPYASWQPEFKTVWEWLLAGLAELKRVRE